MQKYMLAAVFALFASGLAAAVDKNPPLLLAQPVVQGSCDPTPACPPAPPVCKPVEPVCKPVPTPAPVVAVCKPEPVCSPTKLVQVPVASVYTEVRTVPRKRKHYVEEEYTVQEKHTQTMNELRTRTATRKVPVETTKSVTYVKLTTVEPCSGNAPRLTRKIRTKIVPTTIMVKEEFEETYTVPVRLDYTVPVTKTRKVAKVEEYCDTIVVPRTVTTMETSVVASR